MSTNKINIEAVNARAKEEQTPMTKIPSVEELINKMQVGECITGFQKADLLTALTADRLALLTELRDSELLENKKIVIWPQDLDIKERIAHNALARAIKAHLDELINRTH